MAETTFCALSPLCSPTYMKGQILRIFSALFARLHILGYITSSNVKTPLIWYKTALWRTMAVFWGGMVSRGFPRRSYPKWGKWSWNMGWARLLHFAKPRINTWYNHKFELTEMMWYTHIGLSCRTFLGFSYIYRVPLKTNDDESEIINSISHCILKAFRFRKVVRGIYIVVCDRTFECRNT